MARWRNLTKVCPTRKIAEKLKDAFNPHGYRRKIVKLKTGYVVKTYS